MTDRYMTSDEVPAFIEGLPSIAEQRAIEEHNKPIIEALSIAVLQAHRLFGGGSPEHQVVCKLYDTAEANKNNRL